VGALLVDVSRKCEPAGKRSAPKRVARAVLSDHQSPTDIRREHCCSVPPTAPALADFSNPPTPAPPPTYPLSWSLLGLIPYLSPPDSDADGSSLAAPWNGDDSQSQPFVQRIADTAAPPPASGASGNPGASPQDNSINEQGGPYAPNVVSQPPDLQASLFSKFLDAINPISPAYAGDEGEGEELPPAAVEALGHRLRSPEEIQQLLDTQARLREIQEDTAAYFDGISSSRVLGSYSKHPEFSGQRGTKSTILSRVSTSAQTRGDRYFGSSESESMTRSTGVFLPATKDTPSRGPEAIHRSLDTYQYIDAVNGALQQAMTRQEAIDILQMIRRSLQAGGYP
jgi:hypothetical protein